MIFLVTVEAGDDVDVVEIDAPDIDAATDIACDRYPDLGFVVEKAVDANRGLPINGPPDSGTTRQHEGQS